MIVVWIVLGVILGGALALWLVHRVTSDVIGRHMW